MNNFKDITISIFKADSIQTKEFEKVMKLKWSEDFIEDFHGAHISSHPDKDDFLQYLAYSGDKILGGCIVSKRNMLNNFQDPEKTKRKYELQGEGYKNLTYMIVDEDSRKLGIGGKILQYAIEHNEKLWLTCIDELIPFYERNGFNLHMKRIDGEKVNLMTYKKEVN